MKVRLMITGGTIDKFYNQSNGELEFDKTHFPEMIKRARIEVDLITEELLLIDSLDMVDSDRQLILDSCEKCDEELILICLLYTSPSPRDRSLSRMPSSA